MNTINTQPIKKTQIYKQKVTRLFFVLVCFSASSLFSQNPFFSWATSIGGGQAEEGLAITTDAAGNIYSTGKFESTVDFDPGTGTSTLTSTGSSDVYILKQDVNGNLVWAKRIGGNNQDNGAGIVIDPSGNVLVTGAFSGVADFDPSAATFTLSSIGNEDIFVLKLDANGNFIWARNMGGSSSDYASSIATSSLGDVYTTGYFQGTADFDPSLINFPLTTAGGADIFVCKLSSAGNFVWAKRIGGLNTETAFSISSTTNGILITGYFQGTVDFDPATTTTLNLTSNGGADAYICALDPFGTFLWASYFGSTGFDVGYSIVQDNTGDILITGAFGGIVDFDPSAQTNTLQSAGGRDVFVAKYTINGAFVWSKNFGGTDSDYGYGIDVDQFNNVYTTGEFADISDFDPGAATFTLSSTSPYSDVFIHKLDASGNFVWVKAFGNSDFENPKAINVDGLGNIYTTGFYENTIDFNTDVGVLNLTSIGQSDFYVHKLSPCTAPVNPINTTALANQTICNDQSTALSASGSGTLTWYATATSTTALTTGTAYTTPTLSTGTYTYYIEAETCTLSVGRTLVTVTVSSCTGLKENNSAFSELKCYPNPSSQFVTIETDKAISKIKITDALGREVKIVEDIQTTSIKIGLSDLIPGIYFITAISDEATKTIAISKD